LLPEPLLGLRVVTADATPASPFRNRPFNKRQRGPLISPERAKRQWMITHLAFTLLGGRDGAVTFLNTQNASLGARPLDLAMDDPQGYAEVESAIRLLAEPPFGSRQ
jgi:hypothetical protein